MTSGISIEHTEEQINTIRLPSENRWQSNSLVAMSSSLLPTVIPSPGRT